MTDKILKIALLVSVLTYQFWESLPKGSFYMGNALFILLLSIVIYLSLSQSLWTFFLLCLSINNLLDELFFSPTEKNVNEVILLIVIPIIWYVRKRYYERKINKQ